MRNVQDVQAQLACIETKITNLTARKNELLEYLSLLDNSNNYKIARSELEKNIIQSTGADVTEIKKALALIIKKCQEYETRISNFKLTIPLNDDLCEGCNVKMHFEDISDLYASMKKMKVYCAICLQHVTAEDTKCMMPCVHSFCNTCLIRHQINNPHQTLKCMVCRSVVITIGSFDNRGSRVFYNWTQC